MFIVVVVTGCSFVADVHCCSHCCHWLLVVGLSLMSIVVVVCSFWCASFLVCFGALWFAGVLVWFVGLLVVVTEVCRCFVCLFVC